MSRLEIRACFWVIRNMNNVIECVLPCSVYNLPHYFKVSTNVILRAFFFIRTMIFDRRKKIMLFGSLYIASIGHLTSEGVHRIVNYYWLEEKY